jgi:type IV secretory pathway VirB2 component (pilin)
MASLVEPIQLSQEPPTGSITGWFNDLLSWFQGTLPVVFLVIVVAVGIVLIVQAKGGLKKAVVFGIGAALVYLILTNVESFSSLFESELPLDD